MADTLASDAGVGGSYLTFLVLSLFLCRTGVMIIGLLWGLAHTERSDTAHTQEVSYVLTMVLLSTQDGLIYLI